jgi:hypothetical protein
MSTRTITPSPHYSMQIPQDAHEDYNEQALSVWRDNDPTVLQPSSTFRTSRPQVSARQRLSDRVSSSGGEWQPLQVDVNGTCDVAAASTRDADCVWWHIYLVTPTLAVYATIAFPLNGSAADWAVEALRTVKFGNPRLRPV